MIAASGNNGEIRFREERLAVFTSSFDAAKTSEYSLIGTRVRLRLSPAFDYSVPLAYELVVGEGKPQRKKFAKHDQFGAELEYFSDFIYGIAIRNHRASRGSPIFASSVRFWSRPTGASPSSSLRSSARIVPVSASNSRSRACKSRMWCMPHRRSGDSLNRSLQSRLGN